MILMCGKNRVEARQIMEKKKSLGTDNRPAQGVRRNIQSAAIRGDSD